MKKEDFKKRLNDINESVEFLNQEKKSLIKEYLESNSDFKIGEKVKVVSVDGNYQYGYISETVLNYGHEIGYDVLKEKKDGTPSMNKIFVYFNDKIEKI